MTFIGVYLLVTFIGFVSGLVFGYPLLGIILALTGLLTWQASQQYRLLQWVNKGAKNTPPDLGGPLSEVVSLLAKRGRQSRKRKRKLQQVLKSFRELAEAVPEAAIITDKEGRIVNFNKTAQKVFELNPKLDIGGRIDHLIRDEGFDKFCSLNEQDTMILQLHYPENIFLELNKVYLTQGNVLIFARDITNIMLLDKKRKAFVDNASHELKTPLTVIIGFLEIMRQGAIPEKWKVPIDEMSAQAERMKELLDDMLALAQLETLPARVNEDEVEIPEFFQKMRNIALNRCPHSVGVYIGHQPAVRLQADKSLLQSMVSNLLVNALLHANSRHAVELTASMTDTHFTISVIDDGIGIDTKHIARITERFYRIDDQRAQANGSGLGLSIVKHSIEAHDGSLEIRSVIGSGSTFMLRFPLWRVKAAEPLTIEDSSNNKGIKS